MSDSEPLYQPFGVLLKQALSKQDMSRALLARETGIAENSLVRYEKAGISEDGQFPPGPKLAKICAVLEIDPGKALNSCLTEDEFWELEGRFSSPSVQGEMYHPYFKWIDAQLKTARRENALLRSGYQALVERINLDPSTFNEEERWLYEKLSKIQSIHDQHEIGGLEAGFFFVDAYFMAPYPISDEEFGDRCDFEDERSRHMQKGLTANQLSEIKKIRKRTLRQSFTKYCQHMPSTDLQILIELFQKNIEKRAAYAKEFSNEKSPEDDLPSPPSPESDVI